jgi:hypothetical protein
MACVGSDAFGAPIRAWRAGFHVMKAYDECTAPDTTGDSTGLPACSTPTPPPSDSVCKLDVVGKGRVFLVAQSDDVRVKAWILGINAACNGEMLDLRMSLRVTANDCAGLRCTLADLTDTVLGSCEVTDGKCKIVTTLNTALPGLVRPNKETHIDVLGCDLKRTTGPSLPPNRTFACGLAIP